MKKFIVIIQTKSNDFLLKVFNANKESELYNKYRHIGMTVSIYNYSESTMNLAELKVKQYKSLNK